MLLPLLTIAGLFLSSRCSQYGCLDNPDNCLKPEYHCHDDKATGQCIKAQVNTGWPDSLIEEPLFEDTFIEGSPSKKSRLSTDTLKGWHRKVTVLFDEIQTYFSRHGLLLSDLTNNQMARLSEALAQVIYKEIKIERESADMERLLQIILDSKNLLLSHGVSFDQLNSKQLDELSALIIHAYLQGGKNQDDTAKESRLRKYNVERKAVHSYTMSNDDLSASQRNIDNTLDAGPSNTVQNTEKQHKDNGLASGSNKTSLLGQTGDSENSFQELKEERQADVSSIKTSLQKQQKDDPVKFKFSTEEKQLQAEAKRDDGQDQINVALAQGMPFTKKEPITQEDVYIIIIVVVVVAIILVVVISTVCYCMKSLERRKKLIGASDQSNDDDYQELCRQHYASKAAEQKDLASRPQRQERNDSTASTPTLVFSPAAHQRNHLNTNKASRNSSLSSWSEEPVTTTLDISTGHAVLSYMEDHMKNKNRLSVEWLALCKYQAENVSSSVGHVNMIRNRAPHILPYDHNRVKLGNTYQQESDYVNASFIIDNDPRFPMYIATQGPLPSTIHHFWQMVWEQGSVAIVMLAPISEDGVAQCARYWPDEGSSVYDGFEIHLVSEHIWCEDYLVRSLYLKNLKTCETRTITQFHFLSWPRNGVPFSPRPLLELRRKVSKCFRGSNSPIVVHCSDGVGRSGTYILIDLVISRMLKGVKEMDIAATLEHLRDQRAGMVTSKDQMEFALCSVAEEVNAILKVLLH